MGLAVPGLTLPPSACPPLGAARRGWCEQSTYAGYAPHTVNIRAAPYVPGTLSLPPARPTAKGFPHQRWSLCVL